MANHTHGLFNWLLGCNKCQKVKKAAKRRAEHAEQVYRTTTAARAGLVKDEEWQRSRSLQQQFPGGW